MAVLQNKIDFAAIVTVTRANINGDPLGGNSPRQGFDGRGVFSDVAIKRKLRNRLQDMGERVFVQSDDRCDDGFKSLKERADGCAAFKKEADKGKKADRDLCAKIACQQWLDVRAFGQVFAFKGIEVSVGVRGPVSVQQAVSVAPIDVVDMQITKSVNSEPGKEGKASDTMGMKYFVDFGVYVIRGSINCQLAEKTGFRDEDAEKIKKALCTLFENDASSARPEGSCEVRRVYWWKHADKTPLLTSAQVQRLLHVEVKKVSDPTHPEKPAQAIASPRSYDDYDIWYEETACKPEVIEL